LLGRYEEAIPLLKRDLAHSDNLWAHVYLVRDYIELGQEDAARAEAAEVERRSAVDPDSPVGYMALALAMDYMGEPAQALAAVQKAMRIDPRCLMWEGWIYQGLGRYQDAITAMKRYLLLRPPDIFTAHLGLAIDYTELGQDDAARAEVAEALRLNPQFHPEMVFRTVGPKGKVLAENTRWSADLRKAGLN
jgi:tetratricopeptide (TPR) repeat protein